MTVLSRLDGFHRVADAIDRVPRIRDRLMQHGAYITVHGQDMPEISGWRWPRESGIVAA
jgi:xylulose-5-phosphate/fructose-6-phosphate phosphoketolase